MKKIFITFILLILVCSFRCYASDASLTTDVTVNGSNIIVSGITNGATEKNVNIIITDSSGSVIHNSTVQSDANGVYQQTVVLTDTTKKQTYTVMASMPVDVSVEAADDELEDSYAVLTQDGNKISVNGLLTSGGGKEVTIYVTNPQGQLSYINQKTINSDGSYCFEFPLTYNVTDGSYTAMIGGTDSSLSRVMAFDYYAQSIPEQDDTVDPNFANAEKISDELFFDSDITVSLSSYIPQISGSIKCEHGIAVDIDIVNTTDNTVIAEDTIVYSDTPEQINYTLPSLISAKDYKITVTAYNNAGTLATVDVDIDTSLILLTIDGMIDVKNGVHLDGSFKSQNTELIDKEVYVGADRTLSFTIPNLISNASCNLKLKGYWSYTEDDITEIVSTKNPQLYNALKTARPTLDSDSDGIITNAELSSVTGILDLSNSNIESLRGLNNCKNITGIIVRGNKLTSLRPLSSLNKLVYVDARNNQITNISTMPKSLRYLDVDYNNLAGLHGLKKAENIEYLSVAHNNLSTIYGIGDKKKLRYLKLNDNNITDDSLLSGCQNLVHADLRNNDITKSVSTENLKHIHYLDYSKETD